MAIVKYSEGEIDTVVKPDQNEEVTEGYLQKKLDKAANPDEDWIEKEASDDEEIPAWAK